MLNADVFLQMYADVFAGKSVSPRGQLCHEVVDYKFTLDMVDSPITSFRARKLNLKYAKQEFLWYVRADKFDDSIEKYATLWAKIKQSDGSYFSNYGQYIFPTQFAFVLEELRRDPDSRRASIVLLKAAHLFHANKDVVCTYAMNFRIRDGKLDMTVMMRSNDAIFGTTNDVFCFSMIYRMMFIVLRSLVSNLAVGSYTHFANSLHIYERHFEMVQQIIADGRSGYEPIHAPWPTEEEVNLAVAEKSLYHIDGRWAQWLLE